VAIDVEVVVCGLDNVGLRSALELRRLGQRVVVVADAPRHDFAAALRAAGADLVVGSPRDENVLRAAGVARARAVALLTDDDVSNLHAALAAQELNPKLRIVIRLFHHELGEHMRKLFRDAIALSASALAAPAFVDAALAEDGEQQIAVDGYVLSVRRDAPESDVLLPLADLASPGGHDGAGPYLLRGGRARSPRRPSPWRPLVDAVREIDRRLLALLSVVALLVVASVAVFHFFAALDPIDALYFTITIVTTTGFGDINLRDAPPALKLYGSALMILGAASLAILFGLIADVAVGARLARQLTTVPPRIRHHVVVCGLGTVGFRIAASLVQLGVPVAAAEVRASDFVVGARRLGVPVLQANAGHRATLEALGVRRARCLIAATDDDVANLQAALGARALNPTLRVVTRLFDPDLAVRVERAFGIGQSRSVSALAAPAFALATLGYETLATLSLGAAILVFARLRLHEGSRALRAPIGEIEAGHALRILRLDPLRGPERPAPGQTLAPGDDVILAARHDALQDTLRWFSVAQPSPAPASASTR
jgi:Trk K+ transport system NAD-binding subunit